MKKLKTVKERQRRIIQDAEANTKSREAKKKSRRNGKKR